MISRERYTELLNDALERYDRYRTMCLRAASIVFVVSPNVIAAIMEYESRNQEALYITCVELRSMRQLLRLRGVDVCIVYGSDEEIFLPALVWNSEEGEIYLGNSAMTDGDLLVDENLLYAYNAAQNSFRETGFTIESGIGIEEWLNIQQYAAGNICADSISVGSLSDSASLSYLNDAVYSAVSAATSFSSAIGAVNYDAVFDNAVRKKHRKAKLEQELNPGNTKAIDDYLNSFAPKQTLQEA